MKKNENTTDRLLRLFVSGLFFIGWYLWLWGLLEISALLIGTILLFTSLSWICPLYPLIKFRTTHYKNFSQRINIILLVSIFIVFGIFSYASVFFSTKFFIEDFNQVNNTYKQLLFNTWKEKRQESIQYYDTFMPEFQQFWEKYLTYKPFKIKFDSQFDTDIKKINSVAVSLKDWVYTGSLWETHKSLENIRYILQDMLKRNWFSLSTMSLVDFHDIMEVLIEAADNNNTQGILDNYTAADEKLKAVEEYNLPWVDKIRENLEKLVTLSKDGKQAELSKQAWELKSSFIKVYLWNN